MHTDSLADEELGVTPQTIEFVEALCSHPRTFLEFPDALLGENAESAIRVTEGCSLAALRSLTGWITRGGVPCARYAESIPRAGIPPRPAGGPDEPLRWGLTAWQGCT